MNQDKKLNLKERIEEIVGDRISTRITDRGLFCKYCGVDGHRIKTCARELTTDILKIIEKEKFRAIEEYAKETIPKINAKWRKRLKAVELDVVLKEKLMEYGVTEASISLKYLKKNPKPLYVVLSQAILKDYMRKGSTQP